MFNIKVECCLENMNLELTGSDFTNVKVTF